jgi:hypothetical protein
MGAAPPQESKASGPPALIAGGTVAVLFLVRRAANSHVKPGGIIIYGAGITISDPDTPLPALGPLLSQSISP